VGHQYYISKGAVFDEMCKVVPIHLQEAFCQKHLKMQMAKVLVLLHDNAPEHWLLPMHHHHHQPWLCDFPSTFAGRSV
jgi:hypothetical protein